MTTSESITVSLDMAKGLQAAGWPQQDSYFVFVGPRTRRPTASARRKLGNRIVCVPRVTLQHGTEEKSVVLAAPTAEEILRRLPDAVDMQSEWPDERTGRRFNAGAKLTVMRWPDTHPTDAAAKFAVMYANHFQPGTIGYFQDTSLANAAASMWIYLKKNNLLTDRP